MIPHKKKTLHLTPLKIIMEPEKWTPEISEIRFGNTIIFSIYFLFVSHVTKLKTQGPKVYVHRKNSPSFSPRISCENW